MACRPKSDGDNTTSSKIFKSLDESAAGRSFRDLQDIKGPSSPRGKTSLDECNEPRSTRADAALRLRETLDGRQRNGQRPPRGLTFEKKAANCENFDLDEDDEGGDKNQDSNVAKSEEGWDQGAKRLSERSCLIAQLEVNRKSGAKVGGNHKEINTKARLNSRFKSTSNTLGLAEYEDFEVEDDQVLEKL